jgi:hypothetical protein
MAIMPSIGRADVNVTAPALTVPYTERKVSASEVYQEALGRGAE